jgi:biotin operon repressor BirA-like protein
MSVSAGEGPLPQRVFQRLDDRDFQSGEALAADLAVTRAAVWKAVEQLRELGVALDASTNKGYRLAPGVSALSAQRIAAQLPPEVRARIETLQVEWTIESTNTRLLDSLPPAAGTATVVLAEHQTGGRGRRGRGWIAPPGGAISRRRAVPSACLSPGSTPTCRRISRRSAWSSDCARPARCASSASATSRSSGRMTS